jgi:hypothetical protein
LRVKMENGKWKMENGARPWTQELVKLLEAQARTEIAGGSIRMKAARWEVIEGT